MNFLPKSEEELQTALLLPKGEYMFSVKHAENAVSKKGNDMIKLSLSVWDDAGKEYSLYDYLLESMPAKLKHFCDATGMGSQYEKGALDVAHCLRKEGVVLLDVEGASPRIDGGFYPPKNIIKDYIKTRDDKVSSKKTGSAHNELNDDIPF